MGKSRYCSDLPSIFSFLLYEKIILFTFSMNSTHSLVDLDEILERYHVIELYSLV